MLNVLILYDASTSNNYSLSLHDALPICVYRAVVDFGFPGVHVQPGQGVFHPVLIVARGKILARVRAAAFRPVEDRKSTRLNSSHVRISYAVFCLKKKNTALLVIRTRGEV